MQRPPSASSMELANWYWKVVRQFVSERFGIDLSRSKLPELSAPAGILLQAPQETPAPRGCGQTEAFVAEYGALMEESRQTGAKVFFVGEAHFRADAELRGKWVLRGEPALVDSTSPSYGEKASYYSAVCLETGEVEWMELQGTATAKRLQPSWSSCGGGTGVG